MIQPERRARDLLQEQKITEPPVPVETIAKNIGAKIVFEPFDGTDDISGILYQDGPYNIIGINSVHHRNRQRFSIAHEIGHLVLHKKKLFIDKAVKIDFRDSTSSKAINAEEIAANAFAAELLMSREFVVSEIERILKRKRSMAKDDLIATLSGIFEVSTKAMEYRLNNLGFLVTQ